MNAGQITEQLRAGALLRRQVRAALDAAGIRYVEHKGLLDSIFVITASPQQWRTIIGWAEAN